MILAIVALAAPPADVMPFASSMHAQSDAGRAAVALELAETLNSKEMTRRQIDKVLGDTFPKAFAQNPQMVALDKEYPGAITAIITAMGPLLTDYMMAALPELWREIAPLYSDGFTTAEMRDLLAFYRGPTGVRVIEAMARGSDYGSTVKRMLDTGETTVTTSDLTNAAASGVAELIRGASEQDRAAIAAISRTSAGRKLPAVTRLVQQHIVAWSARPTPEIDARMEKVIADALDAHVARSSKP